jgi:multidrug efflux pump subunit AcrA (membrane-fusion protein)
MTSPFPRPDSPPPLKPVTPPARSAFRGWPILVLTTALLIAAWFFRPAEHKTSAPIIIPIARATRGLVGPTSRVAGSVSAGRFANISAPILRAPDQGRGLTLTFLATSGTRVKEGDVIAELDTADVVDHIDDVQADVAQSALDIKRRKAVYIAQLEYLRQRLRVCKATLEKAKQDARATEVKPAYQQEYLQLAVKEAQLEFDEVTKQIPLTDERQIADLRVYELSYQYQVRHLQHHLDDLRHCKIHSPMSGMVVMQTVYRGGEMNQIKVGDRLSPGQPFMRVVDPRSMQLDASISQTDGEMLHLGQPATIQFDAFPGLVAHGHVASVGAIAYNARRINYWVRQVMVRVSLEDAGDRVIPDLTASADIRVSDPVEGLVLPREAVVKDDGKAMVYVKHEGTFALQEVEIAGVNNTQVAVAGGIHEGDEVALHPSAGRAF